MCIVVFLRERELERSDLVGEWASKLACFGRASSVDLPRNLKRRTLLI